MQIWEMTQRISYLYVNNSYTTVSSPKANVNGVSGAVVAEGNEAPDTKSSGIGEAKTQGMSAPMGDGELTVQGDFIPLETNSNHNSRVVGTGGVGGGGQQQHGSGVAVSGVTDGQPPKRKRDNKASTFGFSVILNGDNKEYVGYTGTPWKERNYSEGIVG